MPRIATFLAITCALAGPAAAEDLCHAPDRSQWIGEDEVAQILQDADYEGSFILVVEDGCLEAKFAQDHRKLEVYIDPVSGAIVRVKED